MDTVFSLHWPEYRVASILQEKLAKKYGYSIYIPMSREEKGVDIAVVKGNGRNPHSTVTFQVKASRTYIPHKPQRNTTKRYHYYTWYNSFDVPKEADFIILYGSYAPDKGITKSKGPLWYESCVLLFSNAEMKTFFRHCKQMSGVPDHKFGFGFDDMKEIILTRGNSKKLKYDLDYSGFLFENRLIDIKRSFA